MRFRGKEIDPIRLWAEYCEVKDSAGPFLPLCLCPNPDHANTRSPAFQINISRPTVHCFSYCGISGSYEHAICVIEGLYEKYGVDTELNEEKSGREKILQNKLRKKKAYREARKIIYRKALASFGSTNRSNIKRTLRSNSNGGHRDGPAKAQQIKEINLADYSYLPKDALKYLDKRGLDQSARARWEIGFDEELQRITIPVRDDRQRLRFLIKRAIYSHQRPAYLYPDESHKNLLLFGACNLDLAMVRSEGLVVVEGSLDTILQHQDGYRNTVGVLGAYVSDAQVRLIAKLRPKRIFLFFDNDAAGVRAVEAAAKQLKMYPCFVPLYPKGSIGKDPGSLNSAEREAAFRKAIPVLRVKQKLRKRREAVRV